MKKNLNATFVIFPLKDNNNLCLLKNSGWFRHEEYDNKKIIKNNEENENIIQKLVSIVESLSKKDQFKK